MNSFHNRFYAVPRTAGLLLVLLFLLPSVWAQTFTLPPSRTSNWAATAGIPGGIPTNYTVFCNVQQSIPGTNIVAVGNGVADDYPALNAAITLCPPNQVVYLPSGKYRITQCLNFPYKNNYILRGAGPALTSLVGALTNTGKAVLSVGEGEWLPPANRTANIMAGATLGSTNITLDVAPVSLLTNSLLVIDQLNDGTNVTANGTYGLCIFADRLHNGTRNLSQLVAITKVNGTTVTFWPPLNANYSAALAPQATTWTTYIQGVGIEDLCITNSNTNPTDNVDMTSAYRCWFKNIESANVVSHHLLLFQGLQCVVRDSYFHDGFTFQVGAGYGVDVRITTASLFENNLFNRLYFPLSISSGCSGNVAGYNYIINTISSPTNYMISGISAAHGAHPTMNLFEGNIVNEPQADFGWGSSSYLTFFRNWLTGSDAGIDSNRKALALDSHSRWDNVVGNVLGSTNFFWGYDDGQVAGLTSATNIIYRLGYPNEGNNDYSGWGLDITNLDTGVKATLLRVANYDYATHSTVNPINSLPASLYLLGRPAFFGAFPWPAIGPDLTPLTGTIPAQARFNSIISGGLPLSPPPAPVLRISP